MILKFKGNEVRLTVFSYDINESHWKFRNDLLIMDDDTFHVVASDDSLIVKGNDGETIYRKLDEEPISSTTDLAGKAFLCRNAYGDTFIDFINKTSAFWFKSDTISGLMNWQIAEYEGYKFLVIDGGHRVPVALIQSGGKDTVQIKTFFRRDQKTTLIRIPPGPDAPLEGSWAEVSRHYSDGYEFPPPEIKYRLDFRGDSVGITIDTSTGSHKRTWQWSYNSTKKMICFPDRFSDENRWAWSLLKVDEDNLVVGIGLEREPFSNSYHTIEFRRVQ